MRLRKRMALGAWAAAALLTSLPAASARADLVPSLDGTLVYDTDLDITWLADANYYQTQNGGLGILSWSNAMLWVQQLAIAGHTGWRLPQTESPDPTCGLASPATLEGCMGSEMGHLFYVELGGTADEPIWMSGDPDLALFQNLDETIGHWSETEYGEIQAFLFRFNTGYQNVTGNTGPQGLLMWPVHPGNITGVAAVPSPGASYPLLIAGLLASAGAAQLHRTRRPALSPIR